MACYVLDMQDMIQVKIYVSSICPFRILQVQEKMKSRKQGLIGYPVFKITGPESDEELITNLITASESSEQYAQLILYIEDGCPTKWMALFAWEIHTDGLPCCRIDLRTSDAITFQMAMDEVQCPMAIVTVDNPYIISAVNEKFISIFKRTRSEVSGMLITKFVLCEHLSNSLANFENSQTGSGLPKILLHNTIKDVGRRVKLAPIATSNNCRIQNLAIAFWGVGPHLPDVRYGRGCAAKSSGEPANRIGPTTAARSFASVVSSMAPDRAEVGAAPTGGSLYDPPAGPGLTEFSIVPRRSTASRRERSPPRAVVVTSALVHSLRGLPLPQAARAVGLSATAFKRACRRLGVARWDYTRGPGRPEAGGVGRLVAAPPPPPPQASGSREGAPIGQSRSESTSLWFRPASVRLAGGRSPAEPGSGLGAGSREGLEEWAAEQDWAAGGGPWEPVPDDALVLGLLARRWG